MVMKDKILYTPEEFAEATGLSVNTLKDWRKNNEGPPYVKLGRAVRYAHSTIMKYIERHTHDPARAFRRNK